jgi:MFS family permease
MPRKSLHSLNGGSATMQKQAKTQEQPTNKHLKAAQQTTLFAAMVASFMFPFAGSSLNIAIPFIGEDFQTPAASLSWIMSAMMLSSIACSVPLGRFADLWGKRRIFNAGIFVFFLSTLLCYFAPAFEFLIVMRIIQGIGGAMLISTNLAILMDVFPPQRRGQILGLAVMSTYIGLSLGPVLGGLITHYLGWRAIFVITASASLFTFIVAIVSSSRLAKMPSLTAGGSAGAATLERTGGQNNNIDLAKKDVSGKTSNIPDGTTQGNTTQGAPAKDVGINPLSVVLYMAAIITFMYGFTVFGQHIYSYLLVAAGVVLLVIFAWHESKVASPVLEVRLFKNNPNFILSNLSALLNYAATFAIGYILALYLEVIKGYPADIAGFILISYPVLMAIVSPIAGRLSDRFSPFRLSSIGMAVCVFAMLSFLLVSKDSPLIHVIVSLMVCGFGFGLFSSPNTNAVMSCVTQRDFSVANSILSTMRSVGQASSMAIITIIMHVILGDALITDAGTNSFMQAFNTIFIVFAVICAAGALLSLRRQEPPKTNESEQQ